MKSSKLILFPNPNPNLNPSPPDPLPTPHSYSLPNPDSIIDFYSTSTFTLLVSSSGDLWEIGSFMRNNQNLLESHCLNLKLNTLTIACNNDCTLLLSTSGRLFGWGISTTGILGPSLTFSSPKLLTNFELSKITRIRIASTYAGCIDEQGAVHLWGTFAYAYINCTTTRLTNHRDFVVKDLCCSDSFLCICTDGGFVYFLGKVGNHCRKEYWELSTFPMLEELCVVQVAAGDSFIAVMSEVGEVFLFDGCGVLTAVPGVGSGQRIVAAGGCLVAVGAGVIGRWWEDKENCGKFTKNYCPLKYWRGEVCGGGEGFEVVAAKGLADGFGVIYNCGEGAEFRENLLKEYPVGWNRGNFAKVIENDSANSVAFIRILGRVLAGATREYVKVILQQSNEQGMIDRMIVHSQLPNALATSYANYYRRSLMLGVMCLKNEMKLQDTMARERIKLLRANNKIKQDAMKILFMNILQAHCKAHYSKLCFAYRRIIENSQLEKNKGNKAFGVGLIIRKGSLRYFIQRWWKRCSDLNHGCKLICSIVKNSKRQKIYEAFSAVSYFSAYHKFAKLKKHTKLSEILLLVNAKKFRNFFNNWKHLFLEGRAEIERELKNYQLSVRLGCKYLIPVLLEHISDKWFAFKTNALHQVKSKYKHFALFITYFIKKRITTYGYLLFGKISAQVTTTPEVSSNYSNIIISPKEDSIFMNSSMLSSLNLLVNSHKKLLNSSAASPKIPKLVFNFSNINKSRFSFNEATIRPPWKPSSGSNSRVTTPKANKKPNQGQSSNKCLRSLNILPTSKSRIMKKKNRYSSKDSRIKVSLGFNIIKRVRDKNGFRLMFFSLSVLKFN